MLEGARETTPTRRRRGFVEAVVAALRPKQWLKNLLVFAVPLSAGRLIERDVFDDTVLAFLCFCGAASATYLINDIIDRDADRLHPKKSRRPFAAGELPVAFGLGLAAVLIVVSLVVAALSTYPMLLVVLIAYVVSTLAYSLGLKNEPVLELALLAGGFVLRAIAGGAASGITISPWFLTVAAFGSLFMAAGKRYSEITRLGDDAGLMRPALSGYTPSYLRFVWSLSATVLVTAYCLWAFQVGSKVVNVFPFAGLSVVPFVLAVLRYALDIDRGGAGAPEDIALKDRMLLGLALAWLILFGLGALGI